MTHEAQGWGGTLMPRPRTFDYDELLRLDGEGLTITEIAARLGHASKDSVYSALKRAKKNGVSGIVFPNDPDLAKPPAAPAPPRAPRPPAKCHANGCTDLAEGRLTHGTFAHPINLSEAARLDQGVPLCRRHYHAATGGYPCSRKRCTRVAYGVAAACSEHQPQPEPTTTPTKEPTMRNGTPGATPAERALSAIPSDISARVSDVLEQQVASDAMRDLGEPAPVTPIGHVGGPRCLCQRCTGERMERARRAPQEPAETSQTTDPQETVLTPEEFANPRPVEPATDPLGIRAAVQRELEQQVDELLAGEREITEPVAGATQIHGLWAAVPLTRVNVARENGSDWNVLVESDELEIHASCPSWDAVERLLATFVRRAA